ncbi:MAG: hypothetical protein BGO43_03830 [Gammaproteobacteria bacterium 39-13]|nr:hypothetical protein [Gammaproteobacteria bacterium]OJV96002.1 MAG: hypothetical protein BGO43_03830 [Gammaproteobacteria bacterium 39-13]
MTLSAEMLQITADRMRVRAIQDLEMAQGGGEAQDRESSMLKAEDAKRSLEIYSKVKKKYGNQLRNNEQKEQAIRSLSEYIVREKLGNDQRFLTDPAYRLAVPEDFTDGVLNERGRYKAALRATLDNVPISDKPGEEVHFGTFMHPGSKAYIGPSLGGGFNNAREVLAYMWMAASDPSIEFIEGEEEKMGGRAVCQEAEKENFITTLAAIQRAHNDGSYSPVDRLLDDPSCDAGLWGRIFKEGSLSNKLTQFYVTQKEEKLKSPVDQFLFSISPMINEAFRKLTSQQQLELINNFHGAYILQIEDPALMKGYTVEDFAEKLQNEFSLKFEAYWKAICESNPVLIKIKEEAYKTPATFGTMRYRTVLESHKKYYKTLWQVEIQKIAEGNVHQQIYFEPFEQHVLKLQMEEPSKKAMQVVESQVTNEKSKLIAVMEKLSALRNEIMALQKNILDKKGDPTQTQAHQEKLKELSARYEEISREKNHLIAVIENKAKEIAAREFINNMAIFKQEHPEKSENYVREVVPPIIVPIAETKETFEEEGELDEMDAYPTFEFDAEELEEEDAREKQVEEKPIQEQTGPVEPITPNTMQQMLLNGAYTFCSTPDNWEAEWGERTDEAIVERAILRAKGRAMGPLKLEAGHIEWFRQSKLKKEQTEEKKEEVPLTPAEQMMRELQQVQDKIAYEPEEKEFIAAVRKAYNDPDRKTTNTTEIIENALNVSNFVIPPERKQHFMALGQGQVLYAAGMKRIHRGELSEGISHLLKASKLGSWEASFELVTRMKYEANFKRQIPIFEIDNLNDRIQQLEKLPQIRALRKNELAVVERKFQGNEISEELKEIEINLVEQKYSVLSAVVGNSDSLAVMDAYLQSLFKAHQLGSVSAKATLAKIALRDKDIPGAALASPDVWNMLRVKAGNILAPGRSTSSISHVIEAFALLKSIETEPEVQSDVQKTITRCADRYYNLYESSGLTSNLLCAAYMGHPLAKLDIIDNLSKKPGPNSMEFYELIFDDSTSLQALTNQAKKIADESNDPQVKEKAKKIIIEIMKPLHKRANEDLLKVREFIEKGDRNNAARYLSFVNNFYDRMKELGLELSHDFYLVRSLQPVVARMPVNPTWLVNIEAQIEDNEENIRLLAGGIQYQLMQDKEPVITEQLVKFVNELKPEDCQDLKNAIDQYLQLEKEYFELLDKFDVDETTLAEKTAEIENAKNVMNQQIRSLQDRFSLFAEFKFDLTSTDKDFINQYLATTPYPTVPFNPTMLVQQAEYLINCHRNKTDAISKINLELQKAVNKLANDITVAKEQVAESVEPGKKNSRANKQHHALVTAETELKKVQDALADPKTKGRIYYQSQAERALDISKNLDENLSKIGPIKRTSRAINVFKSAVNKIFGWLGVNLKEDKTLSKKEQDALKAPHVEIKQVMQDRSPEQQKFRQKMLFMDNVKSKKLSFSEQDLKDAHMYLNTHLSVEDLNLNKEGLKEFLKEGVNAQIKQCKHEPIIIEFRSLDGSNAMSVEVSKYLFEQYIKKQRESQTSTPSDRLPQRPIS